MTGACAITRRTLFSAGAALLATGRVAPPAFAADVSHGRIEPALDLPDIELTLEDGRVAQLPALLDGRATAIQLMLPSCTSTCPIGAATFAQVQALLSPAQRARMLLLSIDVSRDGHSADDVAMWLQRFGARPGWHAAVPRRGTLPAVEKVFGRRNDPGDRHSDQIQIVNRAGKLVWRTYELPAAEDIVALLERA